MNEGKRKPSSTCKKDEIIGTLHFDSETGMPQYDPVARKVYVNLQDQNIFAIIDPATDKVVGRYSVGGARAIMEWRLTRSITALFSPAKETT